MLQKKQLRSVMFVLLVACVPQTESKTITYMNIVILSDMSSRLTNRPPKDIEQIHKIVTHFKDECVKPREKIGDKSSISFAVLSEDVSASIDIGRLKNLGEKQQFVNSTGKYVNDGLLQQMMIFENTIATKYSSSMSYGLDLISLLLEKIEKDLIVKMNTNLTDGIDTTFVTYDNHVYIFTDGYLEYLNPDANRQFYFGNPEIARLRQYCQDKQLSIEEALRDNPSLCIPSSQSVKHHSISLHIFETHERDFDTKMQTYKHPKGMRDNEILEAVWKRWASDSGFKSLEWKKY